MQPQTIQHHPPSSFPRRPRPRLFRRVPPVRQPAAVVQPAMPPMYRTQVIPFWLIARIVQYGVWTLCLLSFTISWIGNISIFGGDARLLLGTPLAYLRAAWPIFGAALLCQAALQIGQFYAATVYGRSSRAYRGLLLLSVAPSLWTYAPLVPGRGTLAYGARLIALFVALWINDAWQERVLVARD